MRLAAFPGKIGRHGQFAADGGAGGGRNREPGRPLALDHRQPGRPHRLGRLPRPGPLYLQAVSRLPSMTTLVASRAVALATLLASALGPQPIAAEIY